MQFLELYGDRLDTELGTADRTQRFTLARRKAEINAGQREFNRLTNCYVRRAVFALTTLVAEYDLILTIGSARFFRLAGAEQLPTLWQLTAASVETFLTGPRDFPRRTTDWLDRYEPGWRAASAGTPHAWYIRPDAGFMILGLTPPPLVPAGDLWRLQVPYVALTNTMTADADIPFTEADEPSTLYALEPYHQALVHYAAAKLELLRRNYPSSDRQMGLFAGYVTDYLTSQRVDGPQHVQVYDYLGAANRWTSDEDRGDPRR